MHMQLMMDWDDIRYFLAVAREGSVNRAGQILGVNHTTVSRRTAAFEERLGTRLFERSRAGYALTQAGEGVLGLAITMEESAQAIDRELFGWDGAMRGRLKVAAPFEVASELLASHLPRFLETYPAIDLELLSSTLTVDLDAREADIAIHLSAKPPEHLIGRRVLSFAHAVYGSATYIDRLSRGEADAKLIQYRGTKRTPDWVRLYFPKARVALRADGMGATHAATRAGIGLAYLPCFLADADPELRRLKLGLSELDWGFWVLSHPDLRATARVRACREFLTETLKRQEPLILGQHSRYASFVPPRAD